MFLSHTKNEHQGNEFPVAVRFFLLEKNVPLLKRNERGYVR